MGSLGSMNRGQVNSITFIKEHVQLGYWGDESNR
jgi:hypothetical protein